VQIRFYLDPESEEPHIHQHGVEEHEVAEVFENLLEDGGGEGDARVGIGRTEAGRFLRVVYVPDPEPDSVFVITAYDLGPKALWALRRRLRRRS
jgi:hypothetical protein